VWQNGSAEVGDGIFRARRHVREQFAADYAIGGQLAERLITNKTNFSVRVKPMGKLLLPL